MYFIPLIIGLLSTLSPFVGLIMAMFYAARNIGDCLQAPLRNLFGFFVAPLVMLIINTGIGERLIALDALIAVGGVILIFVYAIKLQKGTNLSLLYASLLLAGYGLLRYQFFGAYQRELFDEGLKLINTQFSAFTDAAMMETLLPIWKAILPAMWILGQNVALVIGYFLFQKLIGIPVIMDTLRFPLWYNFLIVAILPLYLFEQTKLLFINALLSLCIIPLLQGMGLCWRWLSAVFANKWAAGIFMIIILIYASIPLVLAGFADMWLSLRNHIHGGKTA